MQALSIVMRVDASRAIGLGHVKRCLALAQALRCAGARVVFAGRRIDSDFFALVEAQGFAVRALPLPPMVLDQQPIDAPPHAVWAGIGWSADAEQTIAAAVADAPDWVLVDHYAFDARWHRKVASELGARIAVIDDLADRDLEADLLVDQNLAPDHAEKYRGLIGAGTRLLAGPRFALLGPSYASAQRHQPVDAVRSIGIFMGGIDAARLSEMAVRACREQAAFIGTIELVTTSSNPQVGDLREWAERDPYLRISVDLPDLTAFFARHDLQIGAGGGATWERCCMGAPALVLIAADNQRAVVPELARYGAAAALPTAQVATVETIGAMLLELLTDSARRHALGALARTLVDGLGARRVALSICARTMQVRAARHEDVETMHRWRNHPATRSASRNAAHIDAEQHRRWFERALADERILLLIGRVGAIDVGIIRFELLSPGESEVSLYLDPALHGLGLGTAMLRAGEYALNPRNDAGHRLVATVLDGNAGSGRLFESAGYRYVNERWEKASAPSKPQHELP